MSNNLTNQDLIDRQNNCKAAWQEAMVKGQINKASMWRKNYVSTLLARLEQSHAIAR